MKYKISMILPVFNVENYLREALESIIRQTIGFEHIEVIMVNDCSTDNSTKIIEEYADKYENFIAVTLTENSGTPGKPRNIGMDKSTGDYLIFFDPDDILAEDMCETLYNKIIEEDTDIVFCRYVILDEHNTSHTLFTDIDEIKVEKFSEEERLLKIPPSIWTKIYKRKFIMENNIRAPEGIWGEDLSFVIESFLMANGIIYLNNYFGYYYRIRDKEDESKSFTSTKNKKTLMSTLEGYTHTFNVIENLGEDKYFPIIFESHLHYWLNQLIHSDETSDEKRDLLLNASYLMKKYKKLGFDLEKPYSLILNKVVQDQLDDSVLITEVSKDFMINQANLEEEKKLIIKHTVELQNQIDIQRQQQEKAQQQIELFQNRIKNQTNQIKSHENKLKLKNNEIKELKPLKGYMKYKTKNILNRLKTKIQK